MKPQVENGFIQIATGAEENDVILALTKAGLYSTEFEVILIVIRKTWGWKKNWDWISISTFQKLTRKSRPMIVQALSDLVVKQILLVNKKDKNKPLYAFNERFTEWTSKAELTSKPQLTSKPELTTLVNQSLPILVNQSLPTKEKKETIQKKRNTLSYESWLLFWNENYSKGYQRNKTMGFQPNPDHKKLFNFWVEVLGGEKILVATAIANEINPFWKGLRDQGKLTPEMLIRRRGKNHLEKLTSELAENNPDEYEKLLTRAKERIENENIA